MTAGAVASPTGTPTAAAGPRAKKPTGYGNTFQYWDEQGNAIAPPEVRPQARGCGLQACAVQWTLAAWAAKRVGAFAVTSSLATQVVMPSKFAREGQGGGDYPMCMTAADWVLGVCVMSRA